jgi:hypothetical protein
MRSFGFSLRLVVFCFLTSSAAIGAEKVAGDQTIQEVGRCPCIHSWAGSDLPIIDDWIACEHASGQARRYRFVGELPHETGIKLFDG